MAGRLKKCKKTKNVAKETNLPETEKKEEFRFDIGALPMSELHRLAKGYVDDPSEKTLVFSRPEFNWFMKGKMAKCSKDPKINPYTDLVKQCMILRKEGEEEEKLLKLQKGPEMMYKVQVKFFRGLGVWPKEPGESVGVSGDCPILPVYAQRLEYLRKYYLVDLPKMKIMHPSTNPKSVSKQSTDSDIEEIPVPERKFESVDINSDSD
ncbi:hypothetical protein TNIN_154891 [Trichonephila inaurata madagascariensis]|uniref:Uncharacterized protein n=1 Tax=Trichonephila inaurata madagascariensis TaxID=2747483 RepID=A0A8X6WQI4_9ARAC|nr:hypothetical protein TNIN_154891 [Trichonephila inaurata madagascariensis]